VAFEAGLSTAESVARLPHVLGLKLMHMYGRIPLTLICRLSCFGPSTECPLHWRAGRVRPAAFVPAVGRGPRKERVAGCDSHARAKLRSILDPSAQSWKRETSCFWEGGAEVRSSIEPRLLVVLVVAGN
jgi:hypothetical protein